MTEPTGPSLDADRPLEVLRRWEASGAIWRVARRTATDVDIELVTCTGDEVVGRLTSSDPAVLGFVGDRAGSDG
jgi:hypothetical protein